MKFILAFSAILSAQLVIPSALDAAPKKKTVAAKPMSNTEFLAKASAINHFDGKIPLPYKCNGEKFSLFMDAIAANRDLLVHDKSEFETTIEFNENINKRENLMRSMGPYLACFSFSGDHPIPSEYNADTQSYKFTVYSSPRIYSRDKSLGSIAGRTVGGVAFRFDRELEWAYDIDLDLEDFAKRSGCLKGHYGSYSASVHLIPTDAVVVKYAGGIYFSINMRHPFYRVKNETHRASLTEAWESASQTTTALATINKIFVVDTSGKVFWECGDT